MILSVVIFTVAPAVGVAEDVVVQTIKVVSDDGWSNSDIAQLLTELLTPAAMLYVGLWFDRRIKEFEYRQ